MMIFDRLSQYYDDMNPDEMDSTSDEMRDEYDFSEGVQGKHYRAYREGVSIRVTESDGTVQEHHLTLEDGAIMLDPDLREHFPDSEAVNKALRSLVSTD